MSSKVTKKTFLHCNSEQENLEPSSFSFRHRTLGLDWRKIAGIDADEIRETGNVELLQDLIFTITFCNVDAEFVHSTTADKNLLKLFKTSQLIIEYLIHCQECLLSTVNKNSHELLTLRKLTQDLEEKLNNERETLKKVKKECHKRRLLVAQYQAELTGLKSGNVPKDQFPCSHCPKVFLSHYYLKMHMSKRHNVDISPQKSERVMSTIVPPNDTANTVREVTVSNAEVEARHREEIEQLKSYFQRELTEMSEKMSEWQRLTDQLRNVQREDSLVKTVSPAPVPVVVAAVQTESTPKSSNFGSKLEDDTEQERRILDQLGGQLNSQFSSFAGKIDERVVQLSRSLADQLTADSRRQVDTLSEQITGLMKQLNKEREVRQLAEKQRDEALMSKQSVTYVQPPVERKQTMFNKARAESQSTPVLALPSSSTLQPIPSSEATPDKKVEKKEKKSFIQSLTSRFKSPKKSASASNIQQPPQQKQQPTLSSTLQPAQLPDLPKVTYRESQTIPGRDSQPFLVALMGDSARTDNTESELTSRPSTSPQRQSVEPKNNIDTLQASMTLPSMSATGGQGMISTGPGESVGSILNTATSNSLQSASGLLLRPKSVEGGDSSITEFDGAVRRQMMEQLERELVKRGVDREERKLTEERYLELKSQLEIERRQREFTHPDFFSNTRRQIMATVEKVAKDRAITGGSTFRSDISSSIHQRNVQIISNATPRSEIPATDSQWTSTDDELKIPSKPVVPVVPAQVAAASSSAVMIGSRTRNDGILGMETKTSPSNLQPPTSRNEFTSPSGTTDDVSTMDVTSSIQDSNEYRGKDRSNDFDETDTDEMMIQQEMAHYQIEPGVPGGSSTAKKSTSQPFFGRPGMGSRPASSLTGISDDDLGP